MKKNTLLRIRGFLLLVAASLSWASAIAQTFTYFQCFAAPETTLNDHRLTVRMKGLHGFLRVDNTGRPAAAYTVNVENVDPDFIFLSEGTTVERHANALTFRWEVAAGATQTVYINPWYLTLDDFYFIAWSDNQHNPTDFNTKLLPLAAAINPVLTVSAGDVTYRHGGCVGGPEAEDIMNDGDFMEYLGLLKYYPTPVFEVPGNHDIVRGGWYAEDDSNYGVGEAMWRKHLGATEYSFDVGPLTTHRIHFLMSRFYYDMPDWCQRHYFGGCMPTGFLRFDDQDSVGTGIYRFMQGDLGHAQDAAARIMVTHHGLGMFLDDHHTVTNAETLLRDNHVNYTIHGHQHVYRTGTDSTTGIPYLITGDANHDNPGFSLVRVKEGRITEQHMLADAFTLDIDYIANSPTLTQGRATVMCNGYDLPYVRLKFRLANTHTAYQAKDELTGAAIPSYSRRFDDYTVVYVETSVADGAVQNIQVDPI